MTPVLSWFRVDVRRRWRSLLVLALLIAVATGTVMTAVAGARRGASAVDRLLEQTLPATLAVLPNQPGFDWEPVRTLPGVEALATIVIAGYMTDGRPVGNDFMPAPGDAELMWTIERPVVFEGRLAEPERADEAVVTQAFVDAYGKRVGDTVAFHLFTPEQIDTGESYGPGPADGPVVEATIVGVVRSAWFGDNVDELGKAIPSAALYAEHEKNFLGAQGEWAFVNALVRLEGGEAAIPDFTARLAELTGSSDIEYWNLADQAREVDRAATFEANSLLVFAAAAGVAALFLVGQSIARFSASTVADVEVLRSVGMSPAQSGLAATLGPGLAAIVGAVLGAAGAVGVSQWFPTGTAALAEPAPGIDVDVLVVIAGVIGVPLLVGAAAAAAATFALRATRRDAPPHASVAAAAVTRAGLPAPVLVGTRFALEPGRGRRVVPVRPALLGAVTGVLGVLAAFTFSSGVDDALANTERWGLVHHVEIAYPPAGLLEQVAELPGVAAVNDAHVGVADSGGQAVTVISADPVGRPLSFVMTSGRPVEVVGEVALGVHTAKNLGVQVGDAIVLTGPLGKATFSVVGVGFVPHLTHNDRVSGALVTGPDYSRLFGGDRFHAGLVEVEPGADPDAVVAGVYAAADAVPGADGIEVWPALPPEGIAQLRQGRALPLFLAAFLGLLAVGAVGHALATAVRRRQHDVAVLRAVGMTRRQSRLIVVTQATVLAMVGLLVGIPLGVALGRTVWRYVAETTPVFYLPPIAWLALALIVPVALVAANLLAAMPGQRAATLRLSYVLRAE